MSVRITLLHTSPRQEIAISAGTTLRAVKRLIRNSHGGSGEGSFYQQNDDHKIPTHWKALPAGNYYYIDTLYDARLDIELQSPVYDFEDVIPLPEEEEEFFSQDAYEYYIKRMLFINFVVAIVLGCLNVEWNSKTVAYILIGQGVLEAAMGGVLLYITEGSCFGSARDRVHPSA